MDIKREGKSVTLYLLPDDIFNNTHIFKHHREFLEHHFKKAGIKITQFHNEYWPDGRTKKQGIKVGRTDSDILPQITVTVTLGINAEEIPDDTTKHVQT